MYLPVTAVYAVIWFVGACFYYGVACAFYTRVGWAHASRAAWSMTCDALFFACLIGVNLVAVAGRLALWLWGMGVVGFSLHFRYPLLSSVLTLSLMIGSFCLA